MDATELAQFIAICVVALAALVAAPIVAYLAEAGERRTDREREHARRPWASPRFV